MRKVTLALALAVGLAGSAQAELPAPVPVSRAELRAEIAEKMLRVKKFLRDEHLAGILISQVRNFSWITAGLGDSHNVITSEMGPATLLVMADGRRYAIASNSEMPRLMAEDLAGLGYEPRGFKWFEDKGPHDRKREIVNELAAGGKIGTDSGFYDLPVVDWPFAQLRFPLTASEVVKYRWLGRHTTEAVQEVCRRIAPGMSERAIEAMTSDALMQRGIRPTVLLIGVDHRVLDYRHANPSDARLARYAMVNVCARRWGLVIAVTRFVHFGPVPADLAHKVRDAALVCTALLAHSRPGTTASELMDVAKKAYAQVGWPQEWQEHHQGGPIGYGEREWVIWPGAPDVVRETQAFAWNPTVQGAKIEDTVLVSHGKVEVLTATPDWPVVRVRHSGLIYDAPAILVR